MVKHWEWKFSVETSYKWIFDVCSGPYKAHPPHKKHGASANLHCGSTIKSSVKLILPEAKSLAPWPCAVSGCLHVMVNWPGIDTSVHRYGWPDLSWSPPSICAYCLYFTRTPSIALHQRLTPQKSVDLIATLSGFALDWLRTSIDRIILLALAQQRQNNSTCFYSL